MYVKLQSSINTVDSVTYTENARSPASQAVWCPMIYAALKATQLALKIYLLCILQIKSFLNIVL